MLVIHDRVTHFARHTFLSVCGKLFGQNGSRRTDRRGLAEITYDGKTVGECGGLLNCRGVFEAKLTEKHLWELGAGRLYRVRLKFGEDTVFSYFGLRDVRYEGKTFLLNGKPVFQRLVLEQG